jgi:membrane protein implicated in regulation of membrane protease activity
MTWSDFYLLCFLVGFALSALSILAGVTHFHFPAKMHLPFHQGHVGHVGHIGHHGGGGGAVRGAAKGGISWFNASTALAFLAWFGGVGYILTRHSHFVALTSLGFSTLAGLFAGFIVFRFMARIVRATEAQMLDWDYRMEGAVGVISSPIRPNGTGEVIFEQNNVRKSLAARSGEGTSLEKGTEVVIERYDNGIAYVKKWDEFTR